MEQKIKVGLNGLGRIGRAFTRTIANHPKLELVAINELMSVENMAHLLKYDSTHGKFNGQVQVAEKHLKIDNTTIQISHEKEISSIPWNTSGAQIIIEATGRFKSRESLAQHLGDSVSKVVVSAPADEDIKTIVLGANDDLLAKEDTIVSNASCTTNSVAPLLEIVDRLCGVEHAFITTVHSYTTDQQLQDGPHTDFRRGRAAAQSIVPTTTGAAKAITRVFPKFEGRIGGAGVRVPVPNGSLTDITFTVKTPPKSITDLHQAFWQASTKGKYAGYLGYTKDPIVSRDIIGEPYSCLYDEDLSAILGKMVKVVGWYDNEIGYSNRLADLIIKLSKL